VRIECDVRFKEDTDSSALPAISEYEHFIADLTSFIRKSGKKEMAPSEYIDLLKQLYKKPQEEQKEE